MASVYEDILTAVKTLVAATTGFTATNQVVIRKRPAYIKGTDTTTFPFVCICPTSERLYDGYMENGEFLDYPVQVCILVESGLALLTPGTVLGYRQTIRRKLRTTTLSGASGVFDVVGYDPSPAFDASAFDKMFDISVQEFVYRASETRNA